MKIFSVLTLVATVTAGGAFAAENPWPENGSPWKDTDGKIINAHGGGMMQFGGKYWWYGECRRAVTTNSLGVSVYSSADLKTWKNEGLAFAKHPCPGSPVGEGCRIERPKVVRSAKTGKFVMFFHLELADYNYDAALVAILTADRPEGPFRFQRCLRPNPCRWPRNAPGEELTEKDLNEILGCETNGISGAPNAVVRSCRLPYVWHYASGQMCRDMTLFTDVDGRTYHVFASEHNSTLHIAELKDDCLDYTGRWWRAGEKDWTEAPAIFRHGGKYWLIGSGCTGWLPNAARLYVADKVTGPWTLLGNPCRGVSPATGLDGEKTYGLQSTMAFTAPDGRIVVAFDEWRRFDLQDSRYHWFAVKFGADGVPYFEP